MTQEDKELLLKDLCGRLPYGVKCYNADAETDFILCDVADIDSGYPIFDYGYGELVSIKPYLRPMSSMTEKEIKEHFGRTMTIDIVQTSKEVIDWLNKKMFDYRGLIEKGLALEAPEGMYKE